MEIKQKWKFNLICLLFLFSCGRHKIIKFEPTISWVHVTEVSRGKYTRVSGYIYYEGEQVLIDNGGEGYYHREYDIKPYDVMLRKVYVYKYYDDDYQLVTKAVPVSFEEFIIRE